jgi:hypothetical protein
MRFTLTAVLITGGLCLGMFAMLWIGLRIGSRHLAKRTDDKLGNSTVETAVFGLLGLLLAFTFYGAASRFDWHRQLDVDEANAIGTAWLRIDLLPEETRPGLRKSFSEYVGARVAFDSTMEDRSTHDAAVRRSQALQQDIWNQALAGCPADCNPGTKNLVFSSLNAMFDIATTQVMATHIHPPFVMYVLLFALALVASLLTGYALAGQRPRSWLHLGAFPAILAVTVYVTLNVEYPRRGTIRITEFDRLLETYQEEMGAQSVRR